MDSIGFGQRIQPQRFGQAGQAKMLARSHQHGAGFGRQQRLHLRGVTGVIQEQQGAPAVQQAAVNGLQLGRIIGAQVGSWLKSADDLPHGLRRVERVL